MEEVQAAQEVMVDRITFALFILFNHFYEDGKHKPGAAPYTTAIFMLIIIELCLLFIIDHFFKKLFGFTILAFVKSQADSGPVMRRLVMLVVCALLYPLNHWFFVTKNGFNRIYDKFKLSDLNTRNNRILYGVILILFYPALFIIVGNLNYIF